MSSIYRIYHHWKSEDFIPENTYTSTNTKITQVLMLGNFFARVLVLAIFVLEPKMIMSHQADLVDRNNVYEERMPRPSGQHSQSKLATLSLIFMMANYFWASFALNKIFAPARDHPPSLLHSNKDPCGGCGAPYGPCVCLCL